MAVIRRNFLDGTTSVLLSAGGVTMTSAELAALPVVAAPDYAWLSLDPQEEHGLPEIVKVTAHSSGAVTATIERGQQQTQGGGPGREHPSGTFWAHPTTALDLADIDTALGVEAAERATGDTTRVINTQANNYTLVLADAGKVVEANKATAISVTVPPNASQAFPTGTIIEVNQVGAGVLTVVAGAGVTLNGTLTAPSRYGSLLLRKRATNEWTVTQVPALVTFVRATTILTGVVGDGVADDTVAIQAWLATITDRDVAVVPSPAVAYKITSTLVMPTGVGGFEGPTVIWQNVLLKSSVAGPAVDMSSRCYHEGRLLIDCQDIAGTIGVRYGRAAAGCVDTTAEHIEVYNAADAGVLFYSTNDQGCYYNHLNYLKVRYGAGDGVRFTTAPTFINQVNANLIAFATIQNNGGSAVVVDGADGNGFGFLEAESNTGWGIDLVRAAGFHVGHLWSEGNIAGNFRFADDPAVRGVYLTGTWDSGTISHTYSGDRSIVLNDETEATNVGTFGMARLEVGAAAVADADQNIAGDRLFVSGGMRAYRQSAAVPFFSFYGKAGAPGGYKFYEDAATLLGELSAANGMRVAGTVKSISGGLDVSPAGSNLNLRLLVTGTGKVQVYGTGGIENGSSVANAPLWLAGAGTPEGAKTAPPGSLYSRTDGGAGTSFYVKESGTGNTGWVAK